MSLLGEIERNVAADPGANRNSLGVLRFITCGSVDDGKSTLIGRLLHDSRAVLQDQLAAVERASRKRGFAELDLSLLTDGLEAEREQGITIDVAYRYFATARRKFIIADTPGHEQYTRNMVTGASTADAAVILVDATKGLLPQSRRHLLIAHLLGIRHVVVAVNKLDLAGYRQEIFVRVREEFSNFAQPLRIPDLSFVPVSALRGDMVVERSEGLDWYDGPTLLEALEAIEPEGDQTSAAFRFPVQCVARGEGRGYLGRVAAGMVRPGAHVTVLPSGRRTRVKGIRLLDDARDSAAAGDSVTLHLEDEIDISRGDMIVETARQPRPTASISATLCWLASGPLEPRRSYLLKHTTRTVKARFAAIDYRIDVQTLNKAAPEGDIRMNDIFRASLVAQQTLFVDAYAGGRATGAFILIDEASHQTVAAGMIE